jgi:hypothetical protein
MFDPRKIDKTNLKQVLLFYFSSLMIWLYFSANGTIQKNAIVLFLDLNAAARLASSMQ